MMSNGSRWGVKGSSEVSEGLTAVYRYEAALDLSLRPTLGEKGAGRLSYVGLSGGFGTVTLGRDLECLVQSRRCINRQWCVER